MNLPKSGSLVQTFPHVFGEGGAADTAMLNTDLESLATAIQAIKVLQATPSSGGVSGEVVIDLSATVVAVGAVANMPVSFSGTVGNPVPITVNAGAGTVTLNSPGVYSFSATATGAWGGTPTMSTELVLLSTGNANASTAPMSLGSGTLSTSWTQTAVFYDSGGHTFNCVRVQNSGTNPITMSTGVVIVTKLV